MNPPPFDPEFGDPAAIPADAAARLHAMAQPKGPKRFFTSDLSPAETLLTRECGFDPLGQVMGSCVYNVGWQYMPNGNSWYMYSYELEQLTDARIDSTHRAFARLQREAQILGADGVVGVRMTTNEGYWAAGTLEMVAIGTAVRRADAPPRAVPFVSNLSGQDHWLLVKDGYHPVGFVFGTSVWFQYPDWRSQNASFSWVNQEIGSCTQGVYTARENAMTRLALGAQSVGAEGVVGVTTDMQIHPVEIENSPRCYIITFTAFGTAIGRTDYHSDVEDVRFALPIASTFKDNLA